MIRFPGWLVFLLFVPLQIWLFLELKDAWGWWPTIGAFLVLGLLATRAARAPWLKSMLFPGWAAQRERRRPFWSGVLLVLAAVSWLLPWGPQPWLPAAAVTSLVKANVR